jgi:predicted AlkP superfamily pyrophosphatase or phosphodiesterase
MQLKHRLLSAVLAAALCSAGLLAQTKRPAVAPAKKAAPAAAASSSVNTLPVKPKLVVMIVADQFRADYLSRFASEYTAGFAKLLKSGAVFTNAHQDHFPTVTAVGHSVTMTGAVPAVSGIVNNEWYDRASGVLVTSVSDPAEKQLGAEGKEAASPRRLLVSTVGDELKASAQGPAKVVGISLKDRAAILPSGHMADGAYWFDHNSGLFVSSTYYFPRLPAWVEAFNAKKVSDSFAGKVWATTGSGKPLALLASEPGRPLYDGIYNSAFGNDLLELEAALDGEKLGQNGGTDILTMSFSSNDAVGHAKGPDSPEVHDICLRTDQALGRFFEAVDKRVGLANTLIVFTADHGVSPVPEVNQARRMTGGRLGSAPSQALNKALTDKYGPGHWVAASLEEIVYLDRAFIESRKLKLEEVQETAAKALLGVPHIERVFTSEDMRHGRYNQDPIALRVAKGFNERRSADLMLVFEPNWVAGTHSSGTSHSMVYNYDSHVPLIFMGPGVKTGRYASQVAVYNLAPTVSTLLDIDLPSGAFGRVLDEMFAAR